MPPPHTLVALSVVGCRLFVRPSVCPVPDPKSRMEGHSKLKIGRMSVPRVAMHTSSKVKSQGHQTDKWRDGKSAISSERDDIRTSNLVYGWSTMTGDVLQAESSGRLF